MKKILLFLLGSLISVPLFLVLSYFSLPLSSPALQNYYILKDYINTHTPPNKKRLVIMSASDGMYGIVGEMIEKETSYYPINYSMFFGTGLALNFRVDKLISILQKGDTLLLPLNYEFYTLKENSQYFSYYQNMLSWGDKNFFYKHPTLTLQALLKSPPSKIPTGLIQHFIAYIKKKEVLKRATYRWERKLKEFHGINADSIDKYGSLRYHEGSFLNRNIKYEYIHDDFHLSSYFLEQYQKLLKFCNENNIKIIFTYPPMIKNEDYKLNQPKFLENVTNFKANLLKHKIPIQGISQNFQFEIKDFYDSPYHLNTQGAEKYTKELIKILNQS